MREKNKKSIASYIKFPQFTTMNVIDGQAGLVFYSSLFFYSLTINNILNIIVLLILAGVTIAAITSNESAPNKAVQARDENEKGAAKDAATLLVAEKTQEYYEGKYVGNNPTARAATSAGEYANEILKTAVQRGDLTIKVDGGKLQVTKGSDTTPLVTGTINPDGTITWDGTTPGSGVQTGNDEVGGPTIVGDNKPQLWDNIEYNPGTISTASIELPEGTEIEKTKLASLNLPQGTALEGDVVASQATDWKILNVTDDGEVLIIPTNGTLAYLSFEGHTGYNNLITALDEVASIYKNPIYAKDARSITYEDVKRVETSSNPYYHYYNDYNNSEIDKDGIECVTDSWNHRYSVDENINIIDHGKKMIATETISGDKKIMIDIPSEEDNVVCSTFYGDNIDWCLELKTHDPLDELSYDYNTHTKKECLLASRKAVLNNKDCTVQVMRLNDGYCRGIGLWQFREDNEVITRNNSSGGSVVPVVSLKKGVTMEKDNNGVWQLTPTEEN